MAEPRPIEVEDLVGGHAVRVTHAYPIDCIRWKMWPIPSLLFSIPLKHQHSFLHRMAELRGALKSVGKRSGVLRHG